MNKKQYILMSLSILLLLSSCIKEDLDDCPTGKYLYFKTNFPKYNYAEIVESVDIYLYDETERLVQQFSYSKEELKVNQYKVFIPQQENGEYTVIALINQTDHYECLHINNLGEFKTCIITENGDSITFKPDDIYHSYKEIEFANTSEATIDTLSLSKNTNHIELEVEIQGYNLPENAIIKTHISGTNGVYNYNNKALTGPKLTYIPHTYLSRSSDGRTLNNISTVSRLWIGDDLTVCIEEHIEGKTLQTLNTLMLTKMISSLTDPNTGEKLYDTNEKLEMEDEYKVKIILDSSLDVLEIKINDWYYVNPGVDL